MTTLTQAFASAIHRSQYNAPYRGVFPVKCNHNRDVVRAVVEFGRCHGFGLEVGSKAELVMAVSMLGGEHEHTPLLICNGYKDREYMELALRVGQLGGGVQVVVVMEQPEEVELAIHLLQSQSFRTNSNTVLGIRAKLSTVHGGHWAATSGETSKFGLDVRQIMHAVDSLRSASLLTLLALLHFHVGSQMSALGEVREALAEGAALYGELKRGLGCIGLRYLDVGGGLAIDYDGSGSESHTSRAYAVEEYAGAVVAAVAEACAKRGIVDVPVLVSESGRALASHHAVVVFDVLNAPTSADTDGGVASEEWVVEETSARGEQQQQHAVIQSLKRILHSMHGGGGGDAPPTKSILIDAVNYHKQQALDAFKAGTLSLSGRALADHLIDAIFHRLAAVCDQPSNTSSTNTNKSKMVHVNLSIFQSAVDSWAIGQVFPILPLSHLHRCPDLTVCSLADLTCDSDGKIDAFINPHTTTAAATGKSEEEGRPLRSLALHSLSATTTQHYRLGMFLTGVYQETMGSAHNMFGTLNSATLRVRSGSGSGNGGGGGVNNNKCSNCNDQRCRHRRR